MKRQLAASPFASPVLKHPCTTRHDQDEEEEEEGAESEKCHAPPTSDPSHDSPASSPRPAHSPSSLTEGSDGDNDEGEELAPPLSLADLCTQSCDLTSMASTACTGYFNAMCLEDSDRDVTGAWSGENRPHPLHSTAANLGHTHHLSNWQQTPVRFAPVTTEDSSPQQQCRVPIPGSGMGMGQSRSLVMDSGVGGSAEMSSSVDAHSAVPSHSPSQAMPTPSVTMAGKDPVLVMARPTLGGHTHTPGKPVPFSAALLTSRVRIPFHAKPLPPLYATPTTRATPTSMGGRLLCPSPQRPGVMTRMTPGGSGSAHTTTPHRYSSGVKGVVGGVVWKNEGVASSQSSPFTDQLLRRKQMLKSQLHFTSE